MSKIKFNEGRDAPAFQEYAASMMSRIEYRTLSLPHRGLLYTLRLECWVNQTVPSNPEKLSKMLGLDAKELNELLPDLAPFFDTQGALLISPELEGYRAKVQHRKNCQSEGGKKAQQNRKIKLNKLNNDALEAPYNQLSSNLEVLSQDKINSNKSNPVYRDEYSIDESLDPDVPF